MKSIPDSKKQSLDLQLLQPDRIFPEYNTKLPQNKYYSKLLKNSSEIIKLSTIYKQNLKLQPQTPTQSLGLEQFLHRSEVSINILDKFKQLENYQQNEQLQQSQSHTSGFNDGFHVKRILTQSRQSNRSRKQFFITGVDDELPNSNLLSLCKLKQIDHQVEITSQAKSKQLQQEIIKKKKCALQFKKSSTDKFFQNPPSSNNSKKLNSGSQGEVQIWKHSKSPRGQPEQNEQEHQKVIKRKDGKVLTRFGYQKAKKDFKLDQLIDDLILNNGPVQSMFPQIQKEKQQNLGQFSTILQKSRYENDENEQFSFRQEDEMDENGTMNQFENQKYAKFEKNSKIRADGMIYNVKQLLRLQRKREKLILENMIKPDEMLEYVRKKNQIQILLENSRNIKKLKHVADLIEKEIENQNTRINEIVNQLLEKFNLKEYIDKKRLI